jgi:hypothetical protein
MKKAPDRLTAMTFCPVLVGHLGHGPVDRDAGVVHQDVDPALLVDHLVQHPAAVIGIADVALVNGDPQVWMLRANIG